MKVSFINKIFFLVSPIVQYKIFGESMEPKFYAGQQVLVQKSWFFCAIKENNVVIAKDPRSGRLIIKRVKKINGSLFSLEGDNKKKSSDSRRFGWVKKKHIIGRVIVVN